MLSSENIAVLPLMETIKTQRSVIETSCPGKVVNIVAARAAHLHSLSGCTHYLYTTISSFCLSSALFLCNALCSLIITRHISLASCGLGGCVCVGSALYALIAQGYGSPGLI